MIYLNKGHFVPYDRLAEISRDLLNLPVSQGTLVKIVSQCAQALQDSMAYIKNQLIQSAVTHFDETGTVSRAGVTGCTVRVMRDLLTWKPMPNGARWRRTPSAFCRGLEVQPAMIFGSLIITMINVSMPSAMPSPARPEGH
jgi:hypothetical protein